MIFSTFLKLAAQTNQPAEIIRSPDQYQRQVYDDSTARMVELKSLIPSIRYDLRYGSANNFMHQRLYDQDSLTFMRLPAAEALKNIQKELNLKGLGIKIFDAYRPYSVTVKMWDLVHDERYVANPSQGSGHNRGISVDLSIFDLETGRELAMGTGFDDFTEKAHHSYTGLTDSEKENRLILKSIMEKYGFRPLSTEWWHYSWPNDKNYSVLDLGFFQL